MKRLKMCANLIDNNFSDYSLLDIGCRNKILEPMLNKCKRYSGADKAVSSDVFECDLEKGLPFEDDSYDVVVALDVLEHLEAVHYVYKDMLRVAKKAVIVSLPNMYYWSFRYNYLIGRGISGKYIFSEIPPEDRHRWVLSYSEAIEFIDKNSIGFVVEHHDIIPDRGRTKLVSVPLQKKLASIWPNLFVYGTLSLILLKD